MKLRLLNTASRGKKIIESVDACMDVWTILVLKAICIISLLKILWNYPPIGSNTLSGLLLVAHYRRFYHFWATVCCRTVVCTVCLSETVYCGQMVGWIKMPLGTDVQ